MKKKIVIVILSFLLILGLNAQTVDKLILTEDIKLRVKIVNVMPEGIMVDEKKDEIYLINGGSGGSWIYNCEIDFIKFDKTVPIVNGLERKKLNDFLISYSDTGLFINDKTSKEIINLNGKLRSGISFILKKESGYIVYFVNEKGIPGAADTEGKIYSNKEAVEYLKQYDSEKYEESLLRAEELGLKEKFLNDEVLVWGETYYSTINILEKFYAKYPFISSDLIQYDQNGYGYQMIFDYDKTKLCIINPDGRNLSRSQYEGYADFLKNDYSGISTSWYVGFGGNIYYYIAGEEYTEVFRIRRTWGEPDFYAMAINGWTDDDYGRYVTEGLAGLSKADLRLLRNTVFALYGYHFNSADLAAHFDKEVWYTDEGKSAADITLPAHRAKLVEMIQALEAVARQ